MFVRSPDLHKFFAWIGN